jgi:hypothetical protein
LLCISLSLFLVYYPGSYPVLFQSNYCFLSSRYSVSKVMILSAVLLSPPQHLLPLCGKFMTTQLEELKACDNSAPILRLYVKRKWYILFYFSKN